MAEGTYLLVCTRHVLLAASCVLRASLAWHATLSLDLLARRHCVGDIAQYYTQTHMSLLYHHSTRGHRHAACGQHRHRQGPRADERERPAHVCRCHVGCSGWPLGRPSPHTARGAHMGSRGAMARTAQVCVGAPHRRRHLLYHQHGHVCAGQHHRVCRRPRCRHRVVCILLFALWDTERHQGAHVCAHTYMVHNSTGILLAGPGGRRPRIAVRHL